MYNYSDNTKHPVPAIRQKQPPKTGHDRVREGYQLICQYRQEREALVNYARPFIADAQALVKDALLLNTNPPALDIIGHELIMLNRAITDLEAKNRSVAQMPEPKPMIPFINQITQSQILKSYMRLDETVGYHLTETYNHLEDFNKGIEPYLPTIPADKRDTLTAFSNAMGEIIEAIEEKLSATNIPHHTPSLAR